MFFPLLLWSFFVTRGDRRMLFPALAIPILAYGLTAFWLTPQYLRVTLRNMQLGAPIRATHGRRLRLWWQRRRSTHELSACASTVDRTSWAVFVIGTVLFFGLHVARNAFLNFRIIGEPGRLVPELDPVVYYPRGGSVWVSGCGAKDDQAGKSR